MIALALFFSPPRRERARVGVNAGLQGMLRASILAFPRRRGRDNFSSRRHCSILALRLLFFITMLLFPISASAEPLRIAYTSISMTYGPLWLTKEAGIFKKYNIEPEMLYIAGGPPSLQALIAGDVAISFTAAGAVVAANLSGSDAVLIATPIDPPPFQSSPVTETTAPAP